MTEAGDPFDPHGDLARELRTGVGHEFRAEAEAAEDDARKMALRSRTLGHVAYEKMVRGDHVMVRAGTTTFAGPIVHARTDLAVIAAEPHATIYVNLAGPVVVSTVDAQSPGTTWDRAGATSFLAALRELDMRGAAAGFHVPVSVGEITGIVAAVTPDHVVIDAGSATHHVPLRDIAVVVVH